MSRADAIPAGTLFRTNSGTRSGVAMSSELSMLTHGTRHRICTSTKLSILTHETLYGICNTSLLSAGIYLIMVESDDMETFTSKVIIRQLQKQ
ncbi:MAG: T9SS type A sorting domain-containing protein [Candidatus Sabulitectum sp.]|nr:T9SS type A sorting domain-containing protein [Candidatus Sabulitectum sp.]